jgi:dTDP-4-amino-4,6-dideoxygalactose transaminase
VYHLFVCRSAERDHIRAALKDAGIGSAVYYTTPLHRQPAFAYLGYPKGSLPATEQLAQDNFSVPIWAGIDAEAQERVVSVVQAAAPVAS